jgi:CheY-like chemotaxis protein
MREIYPYEKALIVDDNGMDRRVAAAVIQNNLFAEEVVCFSSAPSALAHLESLFALPAALPAFIFLDVDMPEMDGFDFLDAYLQFPEDIQKRSTIIIVSATNSEEKLERIQSYPIVSMFFEKPLSHKILNGIRSRMNDETAI